MEFEKKDKVMEKSWNFKMPLWKNHGNFFLRCTRIIQKNFALRAHIAMMIMKLMFVSYFVDKV